MARPDARPARVGMPPFARGVGVLVALLAHGVDASSLPLMEPDSEEVGQPNSVWSRPSVSLSDTPSFDAEGDSFAEVEQPEVDLEADAPNVRDLESTSQLWGAKPEVKVSTYNAAGVNNNPFEYFPMKPVADDCVWVCTDGTPVDGKCEVDGEPTGEPATRRPKAEYKDGKPFKLTFGQVAKDTIATKTMRLLAMVELLADSDETPMSKYFTWHNLRTMQSKISSGIQGKKIVTTFLDPGGTPTSYEYKPVDVEEVSKKCGDPDTTESDRWKFDPLKDLRPLADADRAQVKAILGDGSSPDSTAESSWTMQQWVCLLMSSQARDLAPTGALGSFIGDRRLVAWPERAVAKAEEYELSKGELKTKQEHPRPSAFSCTEGGMPAKQDDWWKQWLSFMFEQGFEVAKITKKGGAPEVEKVFGAVARTAPVPSKDFENYLMPGSFEGHDNKNLRDFKHGLQFELFLIWLAAFDSLMYKLLDGAAKGLGESLNLLTVSLCTEMGERQVTSAKMVMERFLVDGLDAVMVQEASKVLVETIRKDYPPDSPTGLLVVEPKLMSTAIPQNSVLLINKEKFDSVIAIELDAKHKPTETITNKKGKTVLKYPTSDDPELVMATARSIPGKILYLFASAHTKSKGEDAVGTLMAVTALAKDLAVQHGEEVRLVFGIDANSRFKGGKELSVSEFQTAVGEGELKGKHCWNEDIGTSDYTVYKARSTLQAQPAKGLPFCELLNDEAENLDKNLKDWLVAGSFGPTGPSKRIEALPYIRFDGRAEKANQIDPKDGTFLFVDDVLFPSAHLGSYPSDHAFVTATATFAHVSVDGPELQVEDAFGPAGLTGGGNADILDSTPARAVPEDGDFFGGDSNGDFFGGDSNA